MERLRNIHPGEVLKEEFMMDMTISELSRATNIPVLDLFELIVGVRNMNIEMALKLSEYYGTTPNYWLNLQKSSDDELNELVQSI